MGLTSPLNNKVKDIVVRIQDMTIIRIGGRTNEKSAVQLYLSIRSLP